MVLIGAVGERVVYVVDQLSATVVSNELLHSKLFQDHWSSS